MTSYSTPVKASANAVPDCVALGMTSLDVHIVGHNQQGNQLLEFYLNTKFRAICTFHTVQSMSAIKSKATKKPCLYLLDCLDCDLQQIHSLIDMAYGNCRDLPIILFNMGPNLPAEALLDLKVVRAAFQANDGLQDFFEGMHTVLSGQTWQPHVYQNSNEDNLGIAESSLHLVSPREEEILRLVAAGMSNQQIAQEVEISLHTVKTHIYNIFKKIDVPNRLQAALWATVNMPLLNNEFNEPNISTTSGTARS